MTICVFVCLILFPYLTVGGHFEFCLIVEVGAMYCKGNSLCLINILSPIYSISVQVPEQCRQKPVKYARIGHNYLICGEKTTDIVDGMSPNFFSSSY